MKSQTLIDFFNERNSLLLKYLQKTNPKQIEDSIHNLRVEIKKIHFLFSYAEHYNHQVPVKSLYRPYHDVFKRTGSIRELQLLQQLIKQFFADGELKQQLNELHKKEKLSTGKLIARIDKDSKAIRISRKKAVAVFVKFPVLPRDEYLFWLTVTIRKQFKTINADKLHESRKTLKAVIYSKRLFPGETVFRRDLNAPVADKLQDLIGVWHDKIILLEWIGKNLKKKKYGTQINAVKNAAYADFMQIRQVSKLLIKS